jgi:hypothetical protein
LAENTVKALKDFFSTAERPVGTSEMMEFWKSLSDEEKAYFKTAELV